MGARAYLLLIQVHGVVDGLPRDLPKNCVLAVEVVTAVHGDEELAVVCVGCILVGARHKTSASMHSRCSFQDNYIFRLQRNTLCALQGASDPEERNQRCVALCH